MKIIITGANGMLGSSLCQLCHNKHKVHALHRDKECFTACSADYSLDLTDTSKVGDVFNQINPDLVIHCAGLVSLEKCEQKPDLAISANVLVTENIAKLCSAETKLVYISTDQVYGETADYSEANEALQPVNQYGKTKLLGEQKVQDLCSNHLIVRTNIFGWNVKPDRISSAEWIYNSLRNGQKITLFNDYTFSPIYTIYLGEIIMRLVDFDFTGVINVGSPTHCSKYDFEILLWQVSHDSVGAYKDSDGWFIIIESKCSHLLFDGRCGIYEDRPTICRTHSNDYCEYDAPAEDGFDLYFPDYESLLIHCKKKFKRWTTGNAPPK